MYWFPQPIDWYALKDANGKGSDCNGQKDAPKHYENIPEPSLREDAGVKIEKREFDAKNVSEILKLGYQGHLYDR